MTERECHSITRYTIPRCSFISYKHNLSLFLKENGIILTAFYSNATRRLQPLDVWVFYPLKMVGGMMFVNTVWKILARKCSGPISLKSLDATVSTLIVKKAFQSCYLSPFNEDDIDYSKFVKQIESRFFCQWRNTKFRIITAGLMLI